MAGRRCRRSGAGLSFLLAPLLLGMLLLPVSPGAPDRSSGAPGGVGASGTGMGPAVSRYVANLSVGNGPDFLMTDPVNGDIYVLNAGSDNVTVLNASTNTVIGSVAVGKQPVAAVFDGANGLIYVENLYSANISVINASTNRLVATVAVDPVPNGIAYDRSNHDIYVDSWWDSAVNVIDGSTNRVVANISVGLYTHEVVYDARSHQLFVSNQASGTVSVVDPSNNTVVATISAPAAWGESYDPLNGMIYVDCWPATGLGHVLTVINGSSDSVAYSLKVTNPQRAVVDLANGDVAVASASSHRLFLFSGSNGTLLGSVRVGTGTTVAAYVAHGQRLYLVNAAAGRVEIIDPGTLSLVAKIVVSGGPSSLLYDRANRDVYVGDATSSTVTVLRS